MMSKFSYSQSDKREADYSDINKSKCSYRSGWGQCRRGQSRRQIKSSPYEPVFCVIMKNLKMATHTKKVSFQLSVPCVPGHYLVRSTQYYYGENGYEKER